MRTFLCGVLFSVLPFTGFGQNADGQDVEPSDSLYREDQFYVGFTYNLLTDLPSEVVPAGFSGGIHAGFIRDFPLNRRRNIGIGIGLGWSLNNFGQTLFIGEEPGNEQTIFRTLEEDFLDYDKNRLSVHSLDVPLQFRWRTSTPESHRFWRVYTGLRLGYAYYVRSNFEQAGNIVRQTDIPEFNRLKLGATFTFGYNTFNFHFYYSLFPFFNDDARLGGERIGMGNFQVGLMFYIF